jgi:hypothetical protein
MNKACAAGTVGRASGVFTLSEPPDCDLLITECAAPPRIVASCYDARAKMTEWTGRDFHFLIVSTMQIP